MIILLDAMIILILVLAARIEDRNLRVPISPDREMDIALDVSILASPGGTAWEVLSAGQWLPVNDKTPWINEMLTFPCDQNCISYLKPTHKTAAYVVVGNMARDIAMDHINVCKSEPMNCGVVRERITVDGLEPVK